MEPNQGSDVDEYTGLIRYINSYRAQPRVTATSFQEAKETPIWKFWKFWKFWKKRKIPAFVTPDEWLETNMATGLSQAEVENRRCHSGWNEVTTKENLFLKYLSYFTGPILYVMEIAVLLAAALRDWISFGVIIGILMLNAIVGWYQEKQGADVVASLKGDIAMKAMVVRDGRELSILARELVPGDIIIVEEGQVIPADAHLICEYGSPNGFEDDVHAEDEEEDYISAPIVAADQSAITGGFLAVDKYVGDTVYYTTACKCGKAYAIVLTTAKYSFVGHTATLVQGVKDQGHFKAIINSISTALLVLVVAFIIAAWIGGFFRHLKIATPEKSSENLLHYVLILLIIGVPAGLPVVTITTFAVGAAYLAKENAIVQKLTAIESLAGVDVLCSDKTGTLTANQPRIREPYVAAGEDVNWMIACATLASSHNLKSLDPIDNVIILTNKRYPKAREILEEGWKTEKFTPFNPVSKRTIAVCTLKGERYTCAKGAPKAILALTGCSPETAQLYKDKATDFARRGFRSLGVAYQKGDALWVLLGMLPMLDPPRKDTAQTIAEAQTLGLTVKMLTGDAIAIAKETCTMLSLGIKVYNSERLIHGDSTETMQLDLIERADAFAEVSPEHKCLVVEKLQQRGHLTAMTGDGINDAPSLKKADCGIAVEGASEAAQSAADIVFLAPGLSSIVSAIKIARQIFQRTKAYIQYRIALCLHLEFYSVTSMIIINETVRTDLVVFLALFAELATVAIAYDNAHYEQRPVEWQLPKIWIISVFLGALLALGTWIIRASIFVPNGGLIQNFGSVQEILFLEISLTESWLIFVTRGAQTYPSWQLVGAIFGVDVLATLFCIFGWISGDPVQTNPPDVYKQRGDGWTDVVTVVIVWLYSIFVTIVIAIVYFLMNKIKWLDKLGRKDRSHTNTQAENVLAHLSKIAIIDEKDPWYYPTHQAEAEADEQR